ncbi:MAG: 50S ribosomal protein L24 [Candidatus Saganbacteria bacterium]|nr:50S ribosomal protein L24 [Candidatus Saganbacteria bacterium]
MSEKIKQGDTVIILKGKDKGKKGKIIKFKEDRSKVLVEGVNLVKRHQKPSGKNPGGIIEKLAPIHISKVMLICSRCGKPTRVNRKEGEKGRKVRVCKKCKEFIDKV